MLSRTLSLVVCIVLGRFIAIPQRQYLRRFGTQLPFLARRFLVNATIPPSLAKAELHRSASGAVVLIVVFGGIQRGVFLSQTCSEFHGEKDRPFLGESCNIVIFAFTTSTFLSMAVGLDLHRYSSGL